MTTTSGSCEKCQTPITSVWSREESGDHLVCPQCGHLQAPYETYPLILPLVPVTIPRKKATVMGLVVGSLLAGLGWYFLFGGRDDGEATGHTTARRDHGSRELASPDDIVPTEPERAPTDFRGPLANPRPPQLHLGPPDR